MLRRLTLARAGQYHSLFYTEVLNISLCTESEKQNGNLGMLNTLIKPQILNATAEHQGPSASLAVATPLFNMGKLV